MTVTNLVLVQDHFADNPNVVFLRPDHFFELIRENGSGKQIRLANATLKFQPFDKGTIVRV